ncbi:hypothetical protein cypCar_00014806 [Cyprinus carpio]|nr:hypothetical protein cypCar_00014806 [Cyprinus carpio]
MTFCQQSHPKLPPLVKLTRQTSIKHKKAAGFLDRLIPQEAKAKGHQSLPPKPEKKEQHPIKPAPSLAEPAEPENAAGKDGATTTKGRRGRRMWL